MTAQGGGPGGGSNAAYRVKELEIPFLSLDNGGSFASNMCSVGIFSAIRIAVSGQGDLRLILTWFSAESSGTKRVLNSSSHDYVQGEGDGLLVAIPVVSSLLRLTYENTSGADGITYYSEVYLFKGAQGLSALNGGGGGGGGGSGALTEIRATATFAIPFGITVVQGQVSDINIPQTVTSQTPADWNLTVFNDLIYLGPPALFKVDYTLGFRMEDPLVETLEFGMQSNGSAPVHHTKVRVDQIQNNWVSIHATFQFNISTNDSLNLSVINVTSGESILFGQFVWMFQVASFIPE